MRLAFIFVLVAFPALAGEQISETVAEVAAAPEEVCTGAWGCLWAFQTLAAGVLAILAAIGTGGIIYRSAHLPVKAERDRQKETEGRLLRLRSLELSEELNLLRKRARQGRGTVTVYVAANRDVTEHTRQLMMLRIPTATSDWLFMSLLPEDVARRCLRLNGMIEDHNFDMERTGGAFGADNFRVAVTNRLQEMEREVGELNRSLAELR